MATNVNSYTITKKLPTESWVKQKLKNLLSKPIVGLFEIEMEMQNNVGYEPKCLLILDTMDKVLVLRSDGKKVLVKTIKPSAEVKPFRSVLHLLIRNWNGTN